MVGVYGSAALAMRQKGTVLNRSARRDYHFVRVRTGDLECEDLSPRSFSWCNHSPASANLPTMKAAPPQTKAVTSHCTPNVAQRAIHNPSQVQFSQTDGGFDSSERVKSERVRIGLPLPER